MNETPIKLGNVYDERFDGASFGGNVWSAYGLAPALKSSGSRGQEFVIVRCKDERSTSNRTNG